MLVLVVANRVPDTVFRGIYLGLVLAFVVKRDNAKHGIGAGGAIRWLQVVVAVVMALLGMADRRICFLLVRQSPVQLQKKFC